MSFDRGTIFLVLGRGLAGLLFKKSAECIDRGKGKGIRYLADRNACFQQFFCPIYFLVMIVGNGRIAVLALKLFGNVVFIIMEKSGQMVQGDGCGTVLVNVVFDRG